MLMNIFTLCDNDMYQSGMILQLLHLVIATTFRKIQTHGFL